MEIVLSNLTAATLRKKIAAWVELNGYPPVILVYGTLQPIDDSDLIFADTSKLVVKSVQAGSITVFADDNEVAIKPESVDEFIFRDVTFGCLPIVVKD